MKGIFSTSFGPKNAAITKSCGKMVRASLVVGGGTPRGGGEVGGPLNCLYLLL